jgi:hypothetical protein
MSNIATRLDSEVLEAEQFLQTPDAFRVLDRGKITQKAEGEGHKRPDAVTYDKVIEAVLAGEEPLEVVTRSLAGLGQQWIVTLKNYPHLVVFVCDKKSTSDAVAQTRRLVTNE